ncbi:hypothetical protein [Enhygromyxa salina]|uniref:Uncharacterized protein n=1 Tax=Enhygromyxa salina TaxID=215803 RepID=A0A2S9YXK9_9BACT|nr:hypothetical protein [Enhygromyxa salina]PRQ09802.1 hypothetical protein ENSA7_05570 [Enhygromyxa salina]
MPEFTRVDDSRPVCKHLRTKALHAYGAQTHDAFHTSRSSSYQCLKTCFVTGPDRQLCVPEACQPGRTCFEPR